MRHRTLICVLAVAAVSLVAIVPSALATGTHEEYVAQVNPICKDAAKAGKRKLARIKSSGDPFVDFLLRTRLYGILLDKLVRHISAIEPAPGDEVAVDSWLDESRRTVRLINRLLHSFDPPRPNRVRTLIKRIGRSQDSARRQASALGLRACAGRQKLR